MIAVAFAVAAVANLLGMSLRNGNSSWAFGVRAFRDILIVQLTGLAQGLAFGMLLLVSAAAIVAYYLLPNLSSALVNVIPGLHASKEWFDLNSAQSALYTHEMNGTAWLQLLVTVPLWVALPAVLGVLRVLRNEIRSA